MSSMNIDYFTKKYTNNIVSSVVLRKKLKRRYRNYIKVVFICLDCKNKNQVILRKNFNCKCMVCNLKKSCIKKYGVENGGQNIRIKQKIKNTFLKNYDEGHPLKNVKIKNKIKETNLEKYGTESPMQSNTVKNKCKETCLEKYGVDSFSKTKEFKDKFKRTNLERYGVDNPSKSNEIINKTRNTKRINKTFNSSKIEKELCKILSENFEVKTQYSVDQRYPFACDFYLPNFDLFIEYNGFWSHGGEFFNADNKEHVKKLNLWMKKSLHNKIYKNCIKTWTISDINKRNTAKQNNINYLVFFNKKNFFNWFDKFQVKVNNNENKEID
jgi:hypothetical protein